jgi:hypothetical protein
MTTCCPVSPASQYPSRSMLNEAKCYSQTPVQYTSARHTNTRNIHNCCTVTISLPFWEQFCRHTFITCKLSYLLRCAEEWKHRPIHSWARHIMGGKWRPSSPGHFTPQERASESLWLGIWLRPRASPPDGNHTPTLRTQWYNPQPSLMPIRSHYFLDCITVGKRLHVVVIMQYWVSITSELVAFTQFEE